MANRKSVLLVVAAVAVVTSSLLGCQKPIVGSASALPGVGSPTPNMTPTLGDVTLMAVVSSTPEILTDTSPQATATDDRSSGLIRLHNYDSDGRPSPASFVFVDPSDAEGRVKPGVNEGVTLNERWLVQVIGQSTDGIFVQVAFLEAGPKESDQSYVGLTGWMYSFWVGYPEPLLPAQYPIRAEPDSLIPYRQDFYNYYVGEIYSTMVAQGTKPADDLAYEALVATQTEWAALQTPQP